MAGGKPTSAAHFLYCVLLLCAPAFSMVKKNTCPDGWRNVSPLGQPVPGTRFIAFKVPLKGTINQRLTPNQKFTPKDLIAAMKNLNVELGLIIDLTYTTRYYDVKDLPKNMEYKKLCIVGFEVPDDPTILQFKKWVRKFLWENAGNGRIIGVHCTNGINRTGYLICRYLIDVEGWEPETAIQAFGEARGHQMDGQIYLTDLRTQPMRSNLGMDMWDDECDILPPPDDMDGLINRFPNEDFPRRPGHSLRIYEDGHPCNDLPRQIQLREFDFINKGPGQRRKPYHGPQFQDELQPLLQIRTRHVPDQFYDEYCEEMHQTGLDFAMRGSGQRLRPFRGHQFCDDFEGSTPPEDLAFVNMKHAQRPGHFREIPAHGNNLMDMQFNRGHGQRRRPFYDQPATDEFQPHMQLEDPTFLNMGRGQRMRPFNDCPRRDGMQPPVGDFEFVSRGRGQRMIHFLDRQHHHDVRREMPLEDFDDSDSGFRCRPFHDNQSFSEQAQLEDYTFANRRPEQKMRPVNDHSAHDDVPFEEYLERSQPFPSQEHFPESPLHHGDYSSDHDDYNRNYRSDCAEDYRRMRPSDEINRGRKSRFAPYPSHSVHHPTSAHQKAGSVSEEFDREPFNCEMTKEMRKGKRLPVVTIDYNYGLPLDFESEDDRACYDLPPRDHYIWK